MKTVNEMNYYELLADLSLKTVLELASDRTEPTELELEAVDSQAPTWRPPALATLLDLDDPFSNDKEAA